MLAALADLPKVLHFLVLLRELEAFAHLLVPLGLYLACLIRPCIAVLVQLERHPVAVHLDVNNLPSFCTLDFVLYLYLVEKQPPLYDFIHW